MIDWRDDAQGKKDYDGAIISVRSRYWPGTYRDDGHPSAHSAIILEDPTGVTDGVELASFEFDADTESMVKAAVEKWVTDQQKDLLETLVARAQR